MAAISDSRSREANAIRKKSGGRLAETEGGLYRRALGSGSRSIEPRTGRSSRCRPAKAVGFGLKTRGHQRRQTRSRALRRAVSSSADLPTRITADDQRTAPVGSTSTALRGGQVRAHGLPALVLTRLSHSGKLGALVTSQEAAQVRPRSTERAVTADHVTCFTVGNPSRAGHGPELPELGEHHRTR